PLAPAPLSRLLHRPAACRRLGHHGQGTSPSSVVLRAREPSAVPCPRHPGDHPVHPSRPPPAASDRRHLAVPPLRDEQLGGQAEADLARLGNELPCRLEALFLPRGPGFLVPTRRSA